MKITLIECQPGTIIRQKDITEDSLEHALMTCSAWCRLTEHDQQRPLGTMIALNVESGEYWWRRQIGPDHTSWDVPEAGSEMPWDWLTAGLFEAGREAKLQEHINELEKAVTDLRTALRDAQEEIEGMANELDTKSFPEPNFNTHGVMREIEQAIEQWAGEQSFDEPDMDDEVRSLNATARAIDKVLERTANLATE
jgi:hypothetical protein